MRILLIEDNKRLSDSLRLSLEDDGFAVDTAFDGLDGEELGFMDVYDIIILDIMLPGKDGIQICRSLRNKRVRTPIIMLTARDELNDRVNGLDSGADDYLVKPFEIKELKARLRALIRREAAEKSGTLKISDLILDPAMHCVSRAGQILDLTAKEFALLEYMMMHPHHLLTREKAEEHLWNNESIVASNVVDVYIRRLRKKVDDPFEEKLIETVRGAGYKISSNS